MVLIWGGLQTLNGTNTGFLYDGLNPVQELNGTTPTANLLTGMSIDEFFRRTDSAGSRDFLTDALGTVLALTDSAGTVQTSYTYEPFGNTSVSGTTSGNSYQYTGRENDGTGVYYYRARYYNPTLQRFISSDPIGLAGGLNTYAYVGGNPLNRIDPLGEDWRTPIQVIACLLGLCGPMNPNLPQAPPDSPTATPDSRGPTPGQPGRPLPDPKKTPEKPQLPKENPTCPAPKPTPRPPVVVVPAVPSLPWWAPPLLFVIGMGYSSPAY